MRGNYIEQRHHSQAVKERQRKSDQETANRTNKTLHSHPGKQRKSERDQ